MGRFDGKVALVTGATSGIGRAAALLFAREGAKVVVSGRREAEGESVVGEVRDAGGEAVFVRADVAKAADNAALVERTLAAYGRLDVAFLNAGTEGTFGPLDEQDEAAWGQTIDINLKGVWLGLKYQIPAIIQSGGGAVVINSSIVADVGMSGTGVYAASKGGVVSLARAAAIEYARRNVRVNVVSPGATATPMAARAFGGLDTLESFAAERKPLGRVGRPEEIAEAAVWLASDAASFVTGQTLTVDGGYTAQ